MKKDSKAVAPKTGMSRLFQLAATKKPLMTASVCLSALASVCSFVPYIVIYLIIRELLGVYPDFSGLDTSRVISFGWIAFGGMAGNVLLYFGALVCSHLAAFGTLYELKINFASHLAKVPLGFHVMVGSGRLRKVMDENVEKIEGFIAHQLPDIAAAFTAPVVMIVILIAVDWRLALAALAGIVIAFVIQFGMTGNEKAKEKMAKVQNSLEEMNNASVEYIRGISVVKAFRQTVHSFRRLRETIQSYTENVISATLSWENSMAAFTAIINNIYLFVVPVCILIGIGTTDYTAFVGKFIFYMLFVPSIAAVLMKVMYVNSNSALVLSGVEAMDEILAKPELSRPSVPKTAEHFDIVFDRVAFSYDQNGETEALSGVSLTAPQGKVTAIVGPSGGGKSTIAHLIPRFFDVKSGSIRIGGVDIRDMEPEYLMSKVSFVFQDVFLFQQSIRDNIAMGCRDASTEQVIAAAKAARCHDFIMKLPNGYETVIGGGVQLSGGEKQRIAIARAIVKDAPIVVLDEATAFSDPENEHLIQKAFEILMKDKTVVMIAHRLGTVRSADKILVIENGKVAEQGTHDVLLKAGGKYHEMWNTYTGTVSWKMRKNEGVPANAE